MIPVNNLPLLDPLRAVPVVGTPLADLVQPDLKPIVNLGYGDPNFGWSTAPANVPTQFGLFPSLSDFEKLPPLLVSGTQDGITKFIGDLTSGNLLMSLTIGPSGMAAMLSDPTALLSSPADFLNNISSAAAAAYGTLLPTADILNAVLTSIPAYDLSLFLDNISNPINAIGLPVAADTGLLTLAGGVEGLVLLDAATTIAGDFGLGALTGLIPF
ncbi:PE-PPE domain-containing protein [Mycobacterium sp.]|uniref:PE-PPE domain-containing protein n=1 Tax=Mycobacterium sp. TaxID=1785 RepID=UPI003D6C6E4E